MKPGQGTPHTVIGDLLSPLGFRRRGTSWSREHPEVVQVVELQHSSWGDQRYLNFGLWLVAVAPPPAKLRERDCHVRLRLDALLVDADKAALASALDPMSDLTAEGRQQIVRRIGRDTLLPALENWCSLASLRTVYAAGILSNAFVAGSARSLLESAA